MIKKRVVTLPCFLLFLSVFFAFPEVASAALGKLEIGYSAPPQITRAMLYVNGRYKGFMYRNRTLAVMVETGRAHIVRVFRQEGGELYQKTEVVRFGVSENVRKITVALQKIEKKAGGQLRMRLDPGTPFGSARLYAGGNLLGTVYKDRTVSFDLPAGQAAVEVRRVWQGKSYRYSGHVQILESGNLFRLVLLKVQEKLNPDTGTQGKALLRIKLDSTSRMPDAELYLDKKLLGTIYRDKYANFYLEAGQVRLQARKVLSGIPYKSRIYQIKTYSGRRRYLLLQLQPE